jgi:hypothetical protein
VARFAPFRVKLWDIASANRGRNNLAAIIDDATDVGVSRYANQAGEMFFTLPANHPQIDECQPMLRHYEVSRWDITANAYSVIGNGLLEDLDATKDEVVFYGIDYLGLLSKDITASNQSYTSTFIGTIINNQFTDLQAAGNSPVAFWTKGTINVSTRTVTVVTSFEERLAFWRGLLEILQGSGTTRPTLNVDLAYPPTFTFLTNRGSDQSDLKLTLGGPILDFRWRKGFYKLATFIRALGVKREGASVLYSTQQMAGADIDQYGRFFMSGYWTDLINQAELDSRAQRALLENFRQPDELYVSLAQGYLTPFGGGKLSPTATWDIADSLPVQIERGPVSINKLFTIWGFEWIGRRDGSEELFLDLLPKLL